MSNPLLELTSEGLFVLDRQSRITFANRAFREACGCDPEGVALPALVLASTRQGVQDQVERFASSSDTSLQLRVQLAATGRGLELTLTRHDHDGDSLYGRAQAPSVHELVDLERVAAAEAHAKEIDTRCRAVFETLHDAMFFADPQGCFFDVNTAACEQLGYRRDELLQMRVRDIAPKPNKTMAQLFDHLHEGLQVRYESAHRRKDGALVPVELTLCKIPYQGGFAVAGIARDLSEQRRIEAETREAHHRMQAILQTVPDLLFEIDAEGVIREFYSLRTDLLTMPIAQLIGKRLCDLTTPEVTAVVMRSVHEALENGLSVGAQYQVRGQRWFELSAARRAVAEGQPACAVALARDITERKQYEQELLRSNEELSRFTYTVSHDLKSPLVTIRSFAGMLRKDLAKRDDERVERDLHFIEKAASRMHQLLEDLLQLSRVGRKSAPPERISLQELTREACELVAGQIAQNGAQIELTQTPLYLTGERTRMLEVFQNVIDNAIKFAKPQEPAHIEIGVEHGSGDERWVVCVRDRGIGIDPRFKHRLFGLFEKLQPDAAGTGIGLALIKRIIDVHGGRVWIESDGVGAGAALRFTLPSMTVEEAA